LGDVEVVGASMLLKHADCMFGPRDAVEVTIFISETRRPKAFMGWRRIRTSVDVSHPQTRRIAT
jgi:hypothetical protein